jgi:hypothetical protein
MLGRLRMSVNDCMVEYERSSTAIFGSAKRGDGTIPISLPFKLSLKQPTPRFDKIFNEEFSRLLDRQSNRPTDPVEVKRFQSSPLRCKT